MKKKTTKKAKTSTAPKWNLKLLYSSPTDPRIETDIRAFEKHSEDFASKYGIEDKTYLTDPSVLYQAFNEYEKLVGESGLKAIVYFYYLRDTDATNKATQASISLIENRMAKAQNKTLFFENSLGNVPLDKQNEFLKDQSLAIYHTILYRIFRNAKHSLSVAEERIIKLKSLPAYEMWKSANQALMNVRSIQWKGRNIPLSQAVQLIPNLSSTQERKKLALLTNNLLKTLAPLAEWEINAIFNNKKIDDELRGYSKPYERTIQNYDNDPSVVEKLTSTVTENMEIAHRFYKLKARLLKQKRLSYFDRAAKIGRIKTAFSFEKSLAILKETFGTLNPKYTKILESFVARGQIDAPPRVGKKSGAYCWSTYYNPTFVLLNHTDDLHSFTTFAHEMGHAFHSEFSKVQGPIYSHYSTSLAETASTLFQSIALEAVFESLPEKEKITVLHDKIQDDIATVFRQVACFNFEKDLHQSIREKGHLSKEEIADLHNKHMKTYLGPTFTFNQDDGYMFVQWGHIRRFFYVYSYAYGQLVTKAFLRRYKQDPSFWSSIEKFLSAGGKDSPENILKEIGIDVSQPDFWMEGLKEIEDDIIKLEKLTKK